MTSFLDKIHIPASNPVQGKLIGATAPVQQTAQQPSASRAYDMTSLAPAKSYEQTELAPLNTARSQTSQTSSFQSLAPSSDKTTVTVAPAGRQPITFRGGSTMPLTISGGIQSLVDKASSMLNPGTVRPSDLKLKVPGPAPVPVPLDIKQAEQAADPGTSAIKWLLLGGVLLGGGYLVYRAAKKPVKKNAGSPKHFPLGSAIDHAVMQADEALAKAIRRRHARGQETQAWTREQMAKGDALADAGDVDGLLQMAAGYRRTGS